VLGRWDSWGLGNNLKEMRESAKFEKRNVPGKGNSKCKGFEK
jgi:hypothetical protein